MEFDEKQQAEGGVAASFFLFGGTQVRFGRGFPRKTLEEIKQSTS